MNYTEASIGKRSVDKLSKTRPTRLAQPTRLALRAALIYVVPTWIYLAYIWYNTRPEFHGLDWLLIGVLTLPVCAMMSLYFHGVVPIAAQTLIGLFVNAIAIFFMARWIYQLFEHLSSLNDHRDAG
jgi:hypothetical protein